MTEVQFNQYTNLLTFAKDWRKYKVTSAMLSKEQFRSAMQVDQYVKIECLDEIKNKVVYCYLFEKNSKYMASSQDLKRLLNKLKKPVIVILVIYKPLNTYGKKVISKFKHLNVFVYRQEIFDLVIPKGPLCYPHRILSREEIIALTNDQLCCYLTNLPKIFDTDPQCIWIGAEVGDVIEIKLLSDVSGETYQYRVVIPKNGRVIAFRDSAPAEEEEDAKKQVDDEDDEVSEYRDKATNDSDVDTAEESEGDEPVEAEPLDGDE